MTEFFSILLKIQLPIIILIMIGFIFQKIFKTGTKTYPKLIMYVLMPAVIFTKFYLMEITLDFFIVIPYIIIVQVCLYILGVVISRILKYEKSMKNAFTNALILFNSGNYGIPLIDLVFKSNPIAMASQMFIVIVQNVTFSTFCVYQSSSGNATRKQAIKNMIKMPTLYVILLIAIIKLTHLEIPQTIIVPLDYLSNAFIGFALVAFGIQLAEIRIKFRIKDVLTVTLAKALLAPIIGIALVMIIGIKGLIAQALIIGISTPAAVKSAIIAKEFNNEVDYATQVVVATTVFCIITLPITILFTTKLLF